MIRHEGEDMPGWRKRGALPALEIAALLLLLGCESLYAADSWEKKPYTEWRSAIRVSFRIDKMAVDGMPAF